MHRFYSRAGQGRLSLSSLLQWFDNEVPSLLGDLKHWGSPIRLTTRAGHLLMHVSAQWSRILGWAQQTLALIGCCATEFEFEL
ncbi:hypothetical protein TNCV_2873671 [Trichonephila clavipes]|nr:hypothetical protein TNCV_2873671 [Trichonephila clavipes]